ncbi:MAG: S9 family peptidase [Bryobacteraceae bacterium]|nr:S9 family peptidase [Bryobacteraceae bacterium]MDW8377559.1 S9 family peptidase [Bryobacterales bacterium]
MNVTASLSLLFGCALLTGVAMPQTTRSSPSPGLPPLIDRELLFGNPEYAGAQISPDGKYLAFLKPWKDTRNIWVKKVDEPFEAARLLTSETKRPISGYFWSRDSKRILFVKDKDGDENFNLYSVDPLGPTPPGGDAPESKDLTGLKGIQIQLYSLPRSRPNIAYIGINDRDKAWHDLYELNFATGEKTLLRKNTDRISSWFFDRDGKLRLATRTQNNGDQEILRVDSDKFTPIYRCGVFDSCGPVRFQKDGKQVYLLTNRDSDLTALALLDPVSGAVSVVESDPLKRVDFGGSVFSDLTDELIATVYVDDKPRVYFRNKQWEADYQYLRQQKPNREVNFASVTDDENLLVVSFTGDTEPGETYLFDRRTKKLTLQYRLREKLNREWLAPMTTVRYPSSDGLEISAYLTLPKGVAPKSLPVIVFPHGGPWARDIWGFNPYHQFLANRGYAVLSPNFRGSTGYGKRFLNLGNGEWGRKMQDDLTWGVKYLVAQGMADPKRIGILGGSYGGYATLAGVTFTPELYRAGVDIVGPSNLITLLESVPPYWEAFRKIMYARMADPNTPEGKAWLAERSPLNHASKIRTPLLVVQGANDPRVNKQEADQIVVALRDRGFAVEYLLAPDEGHGFARPVNNMAMLMAIERFLARHLDGRYQEGGPADVVARLKEITVDPKTVQLPAKLDPAAISSSAPKPARTLKPTVLRYEAKLSAGGRELSLKISTTLKEENGRWVAIESTESATGQATDTVTLDKESLVVLKRDFQQGPLTIQMSVDGNQVTGAMNLNGQQRPIRATLSAPLFADGAGSALAVGALPLAEGYSTVIRNFDMMQHKEKLTRVAVAGSERVTVGGATYDAFRVELTPADGSAGKVQLWIAKESRMPVKMLASIPQVPGATLTAELQP